MSQSNSHFKHPARASFELGYLLRSLPKHLHHEDLSADQVLEIEAADLHAMNSGSVLLRGLQGLGRILWCAGVNEELAVDAGDFADVGLLVTEIALQLQFLDEFRQSVAECELRIANGKGQK